MPNHLNPPLNTWVKDTQKLCHLVELDPDMQARPSLHQVVSARGFQCPQVEYPLDHLAEILGTGFPCVFHNPGIQYHVGRAHNHRNNYLWGLTSRYTLPRPSRIPTPTTAKKIAKAIPMFFGSVVSVFELMLELYMLSSREKQRRILRNTRLGTIMTTLSV